MKIRPLSSFLSFLLIVSFGSKSFAQFTNTGATLIIQSGSTLFVDGDFYNQSGSIINLGNITLNGNWKNDDLQGAFNIASTGNVNFTGANQTIGGLTPTIFPNVILAGSGVKTLLINSSINGTLNLNDREFALNANNLFILSNNPNTISFTNGFVSTEQKGYLYRNTNSQSDYLFPLGSVSTANLVYRPVSVKAKDNANNTFGVSFIDRDPSTEGYNINSKRFDVGQVNPNFFHIVNQFSGNSAADFTFYYNNPGDGNFNQLVDWIRFNLWEKIGIANPQPFSGGNVQLNQTMTFSSLQTVSNLPIALASIVSNNDPLTFFNSFTPDGDGVNDRWEIKNIDLFPDNNLVILNRWGSEILNVKGYNNANAWDGLGLNNGTYFYILKVKINGENKVYKGFITLVKK